MRLGRIILALLAPLVSVHPAFRADAPPEHKQPSADSLTNSASAIWTPLIHLDAARSHGSPVPHAASFATAASVHQVTPDLFARFVMKNAQLLLISRQHQRLLLRC